MVTGVRFSYGSPFLRSHSSAGRASALQAEGHRFDPCCDHHLKKYGSVAQLVRVPACHAGGRGFEPLLNRHICWHGSTVEQLTCNQQVVGSIPIASSKNMEEFPSGQRGQTVNLLSVTSMVRIHPLPPKTTSYKVVFLPIRGRDKI